jgi:hypothetical protein
MLKRKSQTFTKSKKVLFYPTPESTNTKEYAFQKTVYTNFDFYINMYKKHKINYSIIREKQSLLIQKQRTKMIHYLFRVVFSVIFS